MVSPSRRLRRRAGWLTIAFGVCCLLGSSSALAQRGGRGRTEAAPPPEAVRLFQQATEHYRDGRFESAAEMLQSAYEIHPDPTFLYNLGRALESAGDATGAIEAYDSYLESPEAPQRRAAEVRRDRLRDQLDERNQLEEEREIAERERLEAELRSELSQSQTSSAPTSAPEPSSPSAVPWIVTGIGAAGLVAGTIVGVLAQARFDEAAEAPNQVDADMAKSDADNLAAIANVFWISSGVVALAGVIWGIVDLVSSSSADDDDDRAPRAQFRPDGFQLRF